MIGSDEAADVLRFGSPFCSENWALHALEKTTKERQNANLSQNGLGQIGLSGHLSFCSCRVVSLPGQIPPHVDPPSAPHSRVPGHISCPKCCVTNLKFRSAIRFILVDNSFQVIWVVGLELVLSSTLNMDSIETFG